jgi:hypothetical protein
MSTDNMTAEEFRAAWPGWSDRWLAYCWRNRLTPGVDRPTTHRVHMYNWIRSQIDVGAPGTERGMIIDHDAFTAHLWKIAKEAR